MSLNYKPSSILKKTKTFLNFLLIISFISTILVLLTTWIMTGINTYKTMIILSIFVNTILAIIRYLIIFVINKKEKSNEKDFMDLLVSYRKEDLINSLDSVLLNKKSKKLIKKHLSKR